MPVSVSSVSFDRETSTTSSFVTVTVQDASYSFSPAFTTAVILASPAFFAVMTAPVSDFSTAAVSASLLFHSFTLKLSTGFPSASVTDVTLSYAVLPSRMESSVSDRFTIVPSIYTGPFAFSITVVSSVSASLMVTGTFVIIVVFSTSFA